MTEYEIIVLLNNAVFTIEDIHDKINELSNTYDIANFAYVSLNLAEEEEDEVYLQRLLSDSPNTQYVVGLAEIDDKFSKLIIRKVK
nr:MAG TPA: hypothetical protein [Caudoviricetes sp.]